MQIKQIGNAKGIIENKSMIINEKYTIAKHTDYLDVVINKDNGKYSINIKLEKKLDKYVLVMIDPDAPSRKNPIKKYVLHYLVIDNKEIISLEPPMPPKDSGEHRYYILLYKYDDILTNTDITKYKTCDDNNPRTCFDLIKFRDDNKLIYVDMLMFRLSY